MTWEEAHRIAREASEPLAAGRVLLTAATGVVLAAPIRAPIAGPLFVTAAMDGYAVSGTKPWQVVGQVRAGLPWPEPLAPGQGVEIATGAQVPAGARAVIPYECTRYNERTVATAEPDRTHIRRPQRTPRSATSSHRLAVLLPPPSWAPPPRPVWTRLGVPATAGTADHHRRRSHHRRLPAPGQVRDALSPIVAALVERAGGTVIGIRHLPDDPLALTAALRDDADVDVVAVTGSSSVGLHDHLHRILAAGRATWYIDGVRCRPGHPQSLARTAAGTWVVGLPGNPYAGLVAGLTILEPLVAKLVRPCARHRRTACSRTGTAPAR